MTIFCSKNSCPFHMSRLPLKCAACPGLISQSDNPSYSYRILGMEMRSSFSVGPLRECLLMINTTAKTRIIHNERHQDCFRAATSRTWRKEKTGPSAVGEGQAVCVLLPVPLLSGWCAVWNGDQLSRHPARLAQNNKKYHSAGPFVRSAFSADKPRFCKWSISASSCLIDVAFMTL